ncbi:proton-conducting transporter membrane subunit [Streptomyces sp. M10(2022)]
MTLGNLAAFFQTDVKRLLAYSTISQVGYLLMPVAVATAAGTAQPALLYYLAAYAVTNLGAFAVVCALPQASSLDDYRGLAHRRPFSPLPWWSACWASSAPADSRLHRKARGVHRGDRRRLHLARRPGCRQHRCVPLLLPALDPSRPLPGDHTTNPGDESRTARTVAYICAALSLVLGVAAGPLLDALSSGLSQ